MYFYLILSVCLPLSLSIFGAAKLREQLLSHISRRGYPDQSAHPLESQDVELCAPRLHFKVREKVPGLPRDPASTDEAVARVSFRSSGRDAGKLARVFRGSSMEGVSGSFFRHAEAEDHQRRPWAEIEAQAWGNVFALTDLASQAQQPQHKPIQNDRVPAQKTEDCDVVKLPRITTLTSWTRLRSR